MSAIRYSDVQPFLRPGLVNNNVLIAFFKLAQLTLATIERNEIDVWWMCTVPDQLWNKKQTNETGSCRMRNGDTIITKTIHIHASNHIFSEELCKIYNYASMPPSSARSNETVPVTPPYSVINRILDETLTSTTT